MIAILTQRSPRTAAAAAARSRRLMTGLIELSLLGGIITALAAAVLRIH